MRIRKQYQVIPTNAKLENGDSTSATNGYTAEYINDHSVVVSATEPSTDRKKVWLQHSSNLFDYTKAPSSVSSTTISTISTGVRATKNDNTADQNTNAKWIVMDISNYIGKTFTLSAYAKSSSTNNGFMYIRLVKSNGDTSESYQAQTTETTTNGNLSISYKIPNNIGDYHYLMVSVYSTRGISANQGDYVDYTNLKLSIAEDKTFILNSDDVYEEFEPQNEVYSTGETIIGTYVDNKPIYRRTYVGTKNVTQGGGVLYEALISLQTNVDEIVRCSGNIKVGNIKWEINSTDFDNSTKALKQLIRTINTSGTARVDFFTINSSVSSISYKITLEYTKTTD